MINIALYLNEEGKIKQWPGQYQKRKALMEYLITKFDDRIYTEQEVNDMIKQWYLLDDYVMIRRYLIEYHLLKRTNDGREYQKYDN